MKTWKARASESLCSNPQSARKVNRAMPRLREVASCIIGAVLCCSTDASPLSAVADQPITVTHVVIDGADSLSHSQIEEVKSAVTGKPASGEVLLDRARHLLTTLLSDKCYIDPDIQLASANAAASPNAAWLHVSVQQGTRYRLRNFRVQWAQVYSAQEIGQLLPLEAMRRGDCSGLTSAENTVTDFYRSRGYRNVKVNSLVQKNKATEQFDWTLYIDERK